MHALAVCACCWWAVGCVEEPVMQEDLGRWLVGWWRDDVLYWETPQGEVEGDPYIVTWISSQSWRGSDGRGRPL